MRGRFQALGPLEIQALATQAAGEGLDPSGSTHSRLSALSLGAILANMVRDKLNGCPLPRIASNPSIMKSADCRS